MKSEEDHSELWEADYHIDEMKGEIPSGFITKNRKAPSGKPAPQTRRPVTLMFRPAQRTSEVPMRALIDGGLARLIATRVAVTAMRADKQAPYDGSTYSNHVKDRTQKL
jgi:hypothetical protein